jgi:hypothetical protein
MRRPGLAVIAAVTAVVAASLGHQAAGASPGAPPTLSDTFSGNALDSGKWLSVWGRAIVRDGRIELSSTPPASPSQSASSLVLSRLAWSDLSLSFDTTTLSQLRQPAPNPWEVAWVFFRYGDLAHYYWLALKPNGWELGKKDGGPTDGSAPQIFLATGSEPVFPIGRRYHVQVSMIAGTVSVTVDGVPLFTYSDPSPLPSGAIGLYEEDSRVAFDDVRAQ